MVVVLQVSPEDLSAFVFKMYSLTGLLLLSFDTFHITFIAFRFDSILVIAGGFGGSEKCEKGIIQMSNGDGLWATGTI